MEMTAMESFGVLVLASTCGGILAIGLAVLFVFSLDLKQDG